MSSAATYEQFDVLQAPVVPGTRLVVEASAGTGKTFSIAWLVVRMVCGHQTEPVPLDRILVVTFTRAAAAELRERIRRNLQHAYDALDRHDHQDDVLRAWLGGADDDTRQTWKQRLLVALQRVDSALITTIHGFCQRVLGWFAFETGADFGLEMLTDDAAIQDDVFHDMMAEVMQEVPFGLIGLLDSSLVTAGGKKQGSSLRKLVAEAWQNRTCPMAWPDGRWDAWCPERDGARLTWKGLTRWLQEREAEIREVMLGSGAREWLNWFDSRIEPSPPWHADASRILFGVTSKNAADATDEVQRRLDRVREWLKDPDEPLPAEVYQVMDLMLFPWHEEKKCEDLLAKNAKKKKAWLEKKPENSVFPPGAAKCPAQDMLRMMRWSLVHEYRRRMERVLMRRGVGTFDDQVQILAKAILDEHRRPALVAAIRSRFDAALIDEFQDTDEHQWTIFDHVFLKESDAGSRRTPARLFLIGDPKQAIYAFRGANVAVYRRAVQQVREAGGSVTTMAANFRSDGPLLAALDRLMGPVGMDPKDLDAIQAAPPGPGVPWQGFFFVPQPDPPASGVQGASDAAVALEPIHYITVQPGAARQRQARWEAGEGWTQYPVVIREQEKSYRAELGSGGDADAASRAEDAGADARGSSLQAKALVRDVIALLGSGTLLLDDGTDDARRGGRPVRPGDIAILSHSNRNLRGLAQQLRAAGIPAVVRSRASVMQDWLAGETLVVLRAVLEPDNLRVVRTALASAWYEVDVRVLATLDEYPERVHAARAFFSGLRDVARPGGGVAVMLQRLLHRPLLLPGVEEGTPLSPARRLARYATGARLLSNLQHLLELLGSRAAEENLPLSAVVEALAEAYMEETSILPNEDEREIRLETDADAVHLITVHSAKGLEFPFVFVDGVWTHDPRLPGDSDPRVVSLDPWGVERKFYLDGLPPFQDTQDRWIRNQMEERSRLLYVALTRARHQVLLYGAHERKAPQQWAAHFQRDLKGPWDRITEGEGDASEPFEPPLAPTQHFVLLAHPACRTSEPPPGGDCEAQFDARFRALQAWMLGVEPAEAEALLTPTRPDDAVLQRARETVQRDLAPDPAHAVVVTRNRLADPQFRKVSFSSLKSGLSHPGESAGDEVGDDGSPSEETVMAPMTPTETLEGLDPALTEKALGPASDEDGDIPGELPDDGDAGEDEATPPLAGAPGAGQAGPLMLLDGLPGGRTLGDAVHRILETIDFQWAAEDLNTFTGLARPAVLQALEGAGLPTGEDAVAGLLGDLHALLDQPLGGPLGDVRLREIPRGDRLDEPEFVVPIGGLGFRRQQGADPKKQVLLRSRELADALAVGAPLPDTTWAQVPGAWDEAVQKVRSTNFGAVAGLLNGFIDLIIRVPRPDGSVGYALLDYKTNYLQKARRKGEPRPSPEEAYGQPGLARAMVEHGYGLQYHLYCVAFHRFMRARLGAAWSWERDMLGVFYPFVRGMALPMTPGSALRPAMFHDRPPLARIEALGTLFERIGTNPDQGAA